MLLIFTIKIYNLATTVYMIIIHYK